MATQRRIGWLIGLLIVLIAVAYAAGTFDAAPSTVDVPTIALETEDITGITINRPDFSVRATKTNGMWQLTEPEPWRADSSSVASFARGLGDLKLESVVSLNPERYGRYGVDSTGSEVVLDIGSDQLHLIVSAEGPDYSTTYVRLDGDERVFVARPRVSIPADVTRWRDRIVTQIPATMIESVTVTSPEESYSVRKAESGWQFSENGDWVPADSAGVARWLSSYSSVRADGFLTLETIPDSLVHNVEFELTGGESRRFTISELDTELAVQFSGMAGAVYRFYSSRKTALVPEAQSLRGTE